MIQLQQLCDYLAGFAPVHLAEEWDNVGLLVGDPDQSVRRVMTCLTITPARHEEAIRESVDVIVTHHPLPFRPLKRLTTEQTPSRLLLQLITAGIAVYSPHTAFDSAAAGINQQLADGLHLAEVLPLVPKEEEPNGLGSGRYGHLPDPAPLAEIVARLKEFLRLDGLHIVGDLDRTVTNIAVACGSAGEFLGPAARVGCEVLVTGETTFHTCLEAEARGMAVLLPGHYASERFAVESLADLLSKQFTEVDVWPSRKEQDPLRWV